MLLFRKAYYVYLGSTVLAAGPWVRQNALRRQGD